MKQNRRGCASLAESQAGSLLHTGPGSIEMRRLSIAACLFAVLCVAILAGSAQQPTRSLKSQSGSLNRAAIEPFVEQHCLSCHDRDVKKGGFAFEAANLISMYAGELKAWDPPTDAVYALHSLAKRGNPTWRPRIVVSNPGLRRRPWWTDVEF